MKKRKTMIAAIVLLLVFIVGRAIAYFTDTDTATNTFTIGNVDITLSEPNWSTTDSNSNGTPDAAEGLVPGQTVSKDPTVTVASTSKDAYVFVKVQVPCKADNSAELFTYTLNSGWAVVTGYNGTCTNGVAEKVYAYEGSTAGTLQSLSANGTATLFNSVTLENITGSEASAISNAASMPVTAYAIQADGLGSNVPATVYGYVLAS